MTNPADAAERGEVPLDEPVVPAPAEAIYQDSHDDVVKAERKLLGLAEGDVPVFGLALSGGGIRSASFALGVLQALYGSGAFEKFHYLSTVSGGGYIGSALTYFRNIFIPRDKLNAKWFPFGYLRQHDAVGIPGPGQQTAQAMGARVGSTVGATATMSSSVNEAEQAAKAAASTVGATATMSSPLDAAEQSAKVAKAAADRGNERARKIVMFLRQHASFMTPSRKLDRPALAAGALRGLVCTVLPYMAILVGGFGIALSTPLFDHRVRFGGFVTVERFVVPADKTDWSIPNLAAVPVALIAGMLAFVLISALVRVIGSSQASVNVENPATARQRYLTGIDSQSSSGKLLLGCAVLFLLALLPWLHDYLANISGNSELPTTVAALVAALGGAAAQIAKLRAVVGGNQKPPSPLKSLWMAIAGIGFVFGVTLLAYVLGYQLAEWGRMLFDARTLWGYVEYGAAAPAAVALAGLGLALLINVNHANQHRIYRDRLMEVFCAEEDAVDKCMWQPADTAQGEKGWLTKMQVAGAPYHLINTCLVTTDSDDRRYRGRGGDNFVLAPLYCGSDATGWAKTEHMGAISIATAAAVSGAALNAHTGPHGSGVLRNKAYAALLSFLGLNLGYWARNPWTFVNKTTANPPQFYMPNLIVPGWFNLSGRRLDENGTYVQLSDGGHFENLAIYELVRRKVRFLWVSDAGQDTRFSFEDFANAIERVRVDFGVNIRFRDEPYDLTHLIPGSAETPTDASKNFSEIYKLARRGYAIGTIEYPDATHGTIVYVKSTLTRGLPADLYGYKARNADYPHQTTLDQFFDEEQFEAYRELGYRLAAQVFRDINDARRDINAPNRTTRSSVLDKVARALEV